MTKEELKRGGRYNWIHQADRLIYIGFNFSGNGYWYQFALVDEPEKVWCEVQQSSLEGIEETKGTDHD